MAKKEPQAYINLQVPAGKANPSPPVGPALGQHGVNIMEFCKAFNAETEGLEQGTPIPVVITVYKDRSFSFIRKSPPASYFIKKAIGLQKGSQTPGRQTAGQISKSKILEIAKQKLDAGDSTAASLEAAARTIEGSARSMGIEVLEG